MCLSIHRNITDGAIVISLAFTQILWYTIRATLGGLGNCNEIFAGSARKRITRSEPKQLRSFEGGVVHQKTEMRRSPVFAPRACAGVIASIEQSVESRTTRRES